MNETQPKNKNFLQRSKGRFVPFAFGALAIAVSVGSASCGDSGLSQAIARENQILQEKGLFGEHPVVPLKDVPGFSASGNIGGSFLGFSGEYQGKTTTMLRFAWKTREEDKNIQISEIPYSKIKFSILEDPEIKPTVSFQGINPANFIAMNRRRGTGGIYEATSNDNLNVYLDNLNLVTVSLSQKDYGAFIRAAQDK